MRSRAKAGGLARSLGVWVWLWVALGCRAELPAEPSAAAAEDTTASGDAADVAAGADAEADAPGPDGQADSAGSSDGATADGGGDSDAGSDAQAEVADAGDGGPVEDGGSDAVGDDGLGATDAASDAAETDSADAAQPVDCNDNITCTTDEVVEGGCLFTPNDSACDDGNACTIDLCGEAGCGHENSTALCDDGNACTTADQCLGGNCTSVPTVCKDGFACTKDDCDPVSGCTAAPVDAACNDSNPCTSDSCSLLKGCVNLANTATCSDGDACTVGDACANESCNGTTALCDDGLACTLDGCDKTAGCTHVPQASACNDKSDCTTDSCDAKQGCVFVPKANGTPCNASAKCTSDMVCKEGACSGGKSVCAQSTKPCHVTTCSESEGCGEVWANNGSPCNDGQACTSADSCSDGACVGGPAPDCSAVLANKGPCWLAVCTPGKGCEAVPAPTGAPCDDEQFCTKTDVCDGAGSCSGAGLPDLCVAGKSDACGTFGCNSVTQVCTVVAKNTGSACTPDAAACATTGVCVANGACAPTDNTCKIEYTASSYPKEPLASGPQMARFGDGRLGLAWLHLYEKGQGGDVATVARQAHFTSIRSDGLPGMPALVYDGSASGHTMGALQVLAGPDVAGSAGALVHLGLRAPGPQQCGPSGYGQTLQATWLGINAALQTNPAGAASLPGSGLCGQGDPSVWMSRQVRFGAAGPLAHHTLILENWTATAATWTLLDAKGAVVWSKPATTGTAMAHDLQQVGDRYVLFAAGTPANGLELAVLDPSAGGPAIASTVKLFLDATVALDVAIAAPAVDQTTWIAVEAKTAFDRRVTVTRFDLSKVPTLIGMGSASLGVNLAGGPARPSVAATDDGWAVAAWEDDLVIGNAAPQRIVRAGGYSVKGGFTALRRIDVSLVAGLAPRVAYAGAAVISWIDGWYQSTMVTRVVPGPSGLVTRETDLAPPSLAAGTSLGHQTAPAVVTTSDGKLRIGWAVGAKAPIQLVERSFDATAKPIDAAPRVLAENTGGVLKLAALAQGGWLGVWTEPELDPATGAVKATRWRARAYSAADAPGSLATIATLGLGQPSAAGIGTALASIPGVSAAVLLASGTTATGDTGEVLRVACLSAQGLPKNLVTIADAPGKARTGLELRRVATKAGASQYWALWSESDAKLYAGKAEEIRMRLLDSDCQPLGPAAVAVAGKEDGNKSIRMTLPQLLGDQATDMALLWVRRDEGLLQGATLQMAALTADAGLGSAATLAGPATDIPPPVTLRNAAGAVFIVLRQLGFGGGTRVLTAPNAAAAPAAYVTGKSQFAVALTEMVSGSPLLVYGQGMLKPFPGKDDSADVYLQVLPNH